MPGGSGLVAVSHMVTHPVTGKEFPRNYWMKPEELRDVVEHPDMKGQLSPDPTARAGFEQGIAKAGGDRITAEAIAHGWACGSRHLEYSVWGAVGAAMAESQGKPAEEGVMQVANYIARQTAIDAAIDEALVHPNAKYNLANMPREVWEGAKPSDKILRMIQDGVTDKEKNEKIIRTVAALAACSQSLHDGETITLYRGVSKRRAAELKEGDNMGTGILSSFTEDIEVAKSFAELEGSSVAGIHHGRGPGAVIAITVPVSSIVMSHRLLAHTLIHSAWNDEAEVTVLTTGVVKAEKVICSQSEYDAFVAESAKSPVEKPKKGADRWDDLGETCKGAKREGLVLMEVETKVGSGTVHRWMRPETADKYLRRGEAKELQPRPDVVPPIKPGNAKRWDSVGYKNPDGTFRTFADEFKSRPLVDLSRPKKLNPELVNPEPVNPEPAPRLGVKTFTPELHPQVFAALKAREAEIVDDKIESASAIDMNGNVLFKAVGDEQRIKLSPDDISKCKDAVFTHNHPGPGSISLSLPDVLCAIQGDMLSMRAVSKRADGKTVVYSVTRPEEGWLNRFSCSTIYDKKDPSSGRNRTFDAIYHDAGAVTKEVLMFNVESGLMTKEEADESAQHEVWASFASKLSDGGINYKVEVID